MSCVKRLFGCFLSVLVLTAVSVSTPDTALAGINFSGDYSPTDSANNGANWNSDTNGYVGKIAAGTLTITNGGASTLACKQCYVGYDTEVYPDPVYGQGWIDINGTGASLICTYDFFLGHGGDGSLSITSGGAVQCDDLFLCYKPTSGGTLTVADAGSTLTIGGCLQVGTSNAGLLEIQNGGAVTNAGNGMIDHGGVAIIDGPGATWNIGTDLTVGNNTYGTLYIRNGGAVNVGGSTYVGYVSTAHGAVEFGPGGGTLTTQTLLYGTRSELTGTGTIVAHGLVSDTSLTFDASHGLVQTIPGLGSVDATLDMSDSDNVGDLGAGYYSDATLTIDGVTVHSTNGILGYRTDTSGASSGAGTVTGGGSWIMSGNLRVGEYLGYGSLLISNGTVSNAKNGYVGGPASGDTVLVTGSNSAWNCDGTLFLDQRGARLTINGGADVTCAAAQIGDYSMTTKSGTVTVDGPGSTLHCDSDFAISQGVMNGTLVIANGGAVSVGGATTTKGAFGGTGSIDFNGGTLTTNGLSALATQLTGAGTIVTNGLVSDLSPTFNGLESTVLPFGTAGTMTVDMSSATSGNGDLGSRGGSSLTIMNGANVYSANGLVGWWDTSGSTATATVDAATWNCGGNLGVGYTTLVTGSLDIINGGAVSVAGATSVNKGTINFMGGTLTTRQLTASLSNLTGTGAIHANGIITDADITFDGVGSTVLPFGTAGTMTVDMSATSGNGDLGLGYQSGGGGDVTIRNGAVVYSANGYLGYAIYSTSGTVNVGAGSAWHTGDLYVSYGQFGSWTLEISNGGTVSSASCVLGYDYGGSGTVAVTGSGSTWTNQDKIEIGICYLSSCSVNVADGGTIIANSVAVARDSGSTGAVNFDGGTLKANAANAAWIAAGSGDGKVYVQEGGATFDTAGYDMGIAMALTGDTASTGGGVTKLGDGTLTLSGTNTYTGLTSVAAGILKFIDTSSDWSGAFLPILGGTATTAGSASIGGGQLLFNYSDTYDDATALSNVQAAMADGTIFAAYHTPPLLCAGNSATDTITVLNTMYGDANVDGSVNGSDLNAVLSNYNLSGKAWSEGDFNFDGSVNGSDLNTVLSNYNQSVSFASTAAVPEPSTLLLMLAGLACLLAYVRSKRK